MLSHVPGIYFWPVKEALAICSFARIVDRAEPAGDGEMLGTLVTLPVGFAAEGLCAVGEGAAVRTFVAFLMFSIIR
jgi:hypothetical protein